MSGESSSTQNILESNVIGCVKWFNNRYGYGFITATGIHSTYGDVFVHHSRIFVNDSTQYKYLVQGEYVSFNISAVEPGTSEHKYQASRVGGVNGGLLMCETNERNRKESSTRPTSYSASTRRPQKETPVENSNDGFQPARKQRTPYLDKAKESSSRPSPSSTSSLQPKSKKPTSSAAKK